MKVNFIDVKELDRVIDGLSPQDKEELAAKLFKKLSAEARSRVIGLTDTGLTVVMGSFVSLNSEIAVNIQNSNGGFDAEAIVKALLEYRKDKS